MTKIKGKPEEAAEARRPDEAAEDSDREPDEEAVPTPDEFGNLVCDAVGKNENEAAEAQDERKSGDCRNQHTEETGEVAETAEDDDLSRVTQISSLQCVPGTE